MLLIITLCDVFIILFQDEKTKKNSHVKCIKLGFTLRFCDSKVYGKFTLSFHVQINSTIDKEHGKMPLKMKAWSMSVNPEKDGK